LAKSKANTEEKDAYILASLIVAQKFSIGAQNRRWTTLEPQTDMDGNGSMLLEPRRKLGESWTKDAFVIRSTKGSYCRTMLSQET